MLILADLGPDPNTGLRRPRQRPTKAITGGPSWPAEAATAATNWGGLGGAEPPQPRPSWLLFPTAGVLIVRAQQPKTYFDAFSLALRAVKQGLQLKACISELLTKF